MITFFLSPLGRWLVGAGLAVALVGGLWAAWSIRGHELASARALAAQEKEQIANLSVIAAHQRQVQAITDKSAADYAATTAKLQADNASLLLKVHAYVSPKADAACAVNSGFIRLLNDAASPGAVSTPPSSADDAPSGIALSDVGSVGVEAINAFRQNAAQLTALQAWIREQEALAP